MQRRTTKGMERVSGNPEARRPAFTGLAGIGVALLLSTTACAPAGPATTAGTPGGTPAATTSATASATASGSAAAGTGTETAGQSVSSQSAATGSASPTPAAEKWQTYTSPDAKVSFNYPAAWKVATPAGAAGSPAVDVDVADAAGTVLASLHYGPAGGLGGGCQNPVPYTVLDSVELALPYNTAAADTITPRFAFRALQEAGRVTASYGITSSVAGKDGRSCMFYNVVSGPAESPFYSFADAVQVNAGGPEQNGNEQNGSRKGAKTFVSLDAARAYMQTPEYVDAKRMITSLKINAG